MKYRVTGANRDTGARMALEFEAESKAAAERKAIQSGMNVNRVEDVTDGVGGVGGASAHAMEPDAARRRVTGMHPVVKLIILLAIVAAIYFILWPMVRARM